MFAVGMVIDEQAAAALAAQVEKVEQALKPHDAGAYLNFTEKKVDLAELFPDEALQRLQRVRSEYDPKGLFRVEPRDRPQLACGRWAGCRGSRSPSRWRWR